MHSLLWKTGSRHIWTVFSMPPSRAKPAAFRLPGGTMRAIATAAVAHEGDTRLKDISFFTAQVDFTESGELWLFINESQIAFQEDPIQEQGCLDARQMAGAFRLLRSNDLI